MYDLLTGEVTGTFRHPQNMSVRSRICDVKVHGDDLLAVDWHGNMQQWKILPNRDLVFVASFTPLTRHQHCTTLTQYTSEQIERLVEFNDLIGVTSVQKLFCVWNMRDVHCVASWRLTLSDILCLKVLGHNVFSGEKNGNVYQHQHQEDQPSILTLTGQVRAKFRYNVTSLSVTQDNVVFGNKDGEIHCSKLPLLPENRSECILVAEHSFGTFGSSVQAIQVDGPRIFSGDCNGNLVIHDFWDYK